MANRRIIDTVLSSSDDEDFFVHRRPKVVTRRIDHFEESDDTDFPARFRLSKESVFQVLQQIRHELEHQRGQNHAMSPMNQLLLRLRFYATGSHLISAGDFSGVSKTSAHRIVHKVTAAIARLRPHHIKFPTMPNEIKQTQLKFFDIARFPRVLGSLDCTHVKIQSLGRDDAEVFRNRKGYFSINVQAVCNANLEFSDIAARWPGSVHDCNIFNNSRIRAIFEADTLGDGLLLGDSGYQLRSYIMTLLGNPRTRSEQLYNESLIRTRNTIERTFGVWKRRFPVVALGSRFQKTDTLLAMIVASAVLRNIARRAGELLPPDDATLQLPAPWEQILEEGTIRHEVRPHRNRVQNIVQNALINGYFQSLIR